MSLVLNILAIDGWGKKENASIKNAAYLFVLLAVLLRIVFWAYTQRILEDALIARLHAENFALGLGLTHLRPGEGPIQSFTSPLSMGVMVLGDLIHFGAGLFVLRVASLLASMIAILFLMGIAIHPALRLSLPMAAVLMGYSALEYQQILFGMGGLETQLATTALLSSVYYLMAKKPIRLGVALGLCMLARPDFGFWTLIAGAYGLFRFPRQMPKVILCALSLYLPWILFATAYYGSPIPQTILAKAIGYPSVAGSLGSFDFFTIKRHFRIVLCEQLILFLAPVFTGQGGYHFYFFAGPENLLANAIFLLALLGGMLAAVRRNWELLPIAAFAFVYTLYYIFFVSVVSHWYKVPYCLMLLLLAVYAFQAVCNLLPRQPVRKWALRLPAAAYLGALAVVLPLSFHVERQVQSLIYDKSLKAAGLYLAEHMQSGEAVGCQPLGYLAYYSRGTVYDWPGLASKKVLEFSRANPEKRNFEYMLDALRPEYMLLRDREFLYYFTRTDWIREDYHPIQVFRADPKDTPAIRWIDRNPDTDFHLYKKNHEEDATPYDESLWPVLPR